LGFFFKNSVKKTEHIELVILLTPIIFEGDVFVSAQKATTFTGKPLKKFDVFRPEGHGAPSDWRGHRPEGRGLASDSQGRTPEGHGAPSDTQNTQFMPKGRQPQGSVVPAEQKPFLFIPLTAASDDFNPKGFKAYN
jgi:hypothetical protein